MRIIIITIGLGALILGVQVLSAQQLNYSETKGALERIKERSDRFKNDFKDDVGKTDTDDHTRHQMKSSVERFEEIAERARDRYGKHNAAEPEVSNLLSEGNIIDAFMSQHTVTPRVKSEWLLIRADLNLLANSYNMTGQWPSALARSESPVISRGIYEQLSRDQIGNLIQDMQDSTTLYQDATSSIENGSLDPSIRNFRLSVDRLQSTFTNGYSTVSIAGEVINRAEALDAYMRNHPATPAAEQSWNRLRKDLIRLALAYNIPAPWLVNH
jgi:hypothetical protein